MLSPQPSTIWKRIRWPRLLQYRVYLIQRSSVMALARSEMLAWLPVARRRSPESMDSRGDIARCGCTGDATARSAFLRRVRVRDELGRSELAGNRRCLP